jgi:hypothetical protein
MMLASSCVAILVILHTVNASEERVTPTSTTRTTTRVATTFASQLHDLDLDELVSCEYN